MITNRKIKRLLRLFFCIFFFVSILCLGLTVFKISIHEKHVTLLIGHRGFSAEYTENTPVAFREAFRRGFDGVELDVYEDADGELLVFHDVSLLRLTGVDEVIWNLTSKDRDKYLIRHGSDSQPQKIPTLEEVFDACKDYRGKILIHLKNEKDLGYEVGDSCLQQIESLVKAYDFSDRVIVFGGKPAIKKFTGRYDLEFGLLTRKEGYRDIITLAEWARDRDIHNILFFSMSALDFYPSDKVNDLAAMGIRTGMYTVESKKDLQKLEKYGLRYALTDSKMR